MTRKHGGFILFIATSLSFLGSAIIRHDQILFVLIAFVCIMFALAGLKNHFKEIR